MINWHLAPLGSLAPGKMASMRRQRYLLAVGVAASASLRGRGRSCPSAALAFSSVSPILPPPLPAVPSVLDVGLPPALPASLYDDLNEHGVAVLKNYATADQCALLRFDMIRLRHGGHTVRAGTEGDRAEDADDSSESSESADAAGTKPPKSIRRCEHYWLVDQPGAAREMEREAMDRASGTTPQCDLPVEERSRRDRYVGPRYVGDLVSTLERGLDGLSPYYNSDGDRRTFTSARTDERHRINVHETEAAYLYYDTGGYYNWHLDTPSRENIDHPESTVKTIGESERSGMHRRAFSFLLYLGDGQSDCDGRRRPWSHDDGGCLRVYPPISLEDQRTRVGGPSASPSASGSFGRDEWTDSLAIGDPEGLAELGMYHDILPEEGTFVLFKSEVVPHEVLPTLRERMAVVGWLHGSLF